MCNAIASVRDAVSLMRPNVRMSNDANYNADLGLEIAKGNIEEVKEREGF